MIEGMEILNKVEIMQEEFPEWLEPACVLIMLIGVITGIIVSAFARDFAGMLAGFALGLFCCIPTLLIGKECMKEVPTGRYRYEVTISDTANFKEIYEKYDIVEQRGDIYVLEEKEPFE